MLDATSIYIYPYYSSNNVSRELTEGSYTIQF